MENLIGNDDTQPLDTDAAPFDDDVPEERDAELEEYMRNFEKSLADSWRSYQLPEDIVLMISTTEGVMKLLSGEYSKEEPSGLSDDEIIRKAGANDFSARSLGPRFKALMAGDPQAIGENVFGAVFELFTILAFWSGRCTEQMLRIFRRSGLYAPASNTASGGFLPDYFARIANVYVRERPVYRKPKVVSPSGRDQNAIIINTGNGFVMLGDCHPENNPRYAWNDIGIANLFVDVYKDTVKYCTDRKKWYVYDGKRWVADDNAAMECCKELVLALHSYSICFGLLEDNDEIKPQVFQAYAKKYLSRGGRVKILKDASSVHTVASDAFDADPYLFNCQNGTYHLRTKRFTGHSPADMITKLSGVRYNKHSEYAHWEQRIGEITAHDGGSDAGLAGYIRKCLGYALTGDTRFECGFVFYGPTGRNGKSLILDTYQKMMGDYGSSTNPETIARSRSVNGSGPKENIARLAGVRFVSISEPDKGMQLSESTIKTLTGNDRIVARYLREGSFEFYPRFKFFINTNYRPFVSDKTVFSRLKIIPFRQHYEEDAQDKTLKDEFAKPESLSGIFNWCCEGLDLLESEGFDEPEAVREAKELYMADNDFLERFIMETFELDEDGVVLRQKAYDAFKAWCSGKEEAMSKRSFLQAMETVPGIVAARMRINGGGRDENPRYCFKGIRWRYRTGAKEENQAEEQSPEDGQS